MSKRGIIINIGLLLFIGALLLAGGLVYLSVFPKTYRAMARIKVEPDLIAKKIQLLQVPEVYGYWEVLPFEEIGSKTILFQVISNLNLQVRWAEKGQAPLALDITYMIFRHRIDIRQAGQSALIELRAEGYSPEEPAQIANEIVQVYQRCRETSRGENLEKYVTLITTKRNDLDEKIKNSDPSGRERLQVERDLLTRELFETAASAQGVRAVTIIDQAEPATRPARPHRPLGALSMLLGGTLLVVALLLATDRLLAFQSSVQNED